MIKRKYSFYFLITAVLFFGVSMHGYTQIAVTSGLFSEKAVSAGTTYSGTISILNKGNKSEKARLYKKDYLFYANGSNEFGEPGSTKRSNATWIEFERDQVEVPPRRIVEVDYKVHVPPKSSLKGSYWSLVMVQPVTGTALDPDNDEDTTQVTETVRYGIQIATHIGDTGSNKLEITNPDMLNEGKPNKLSIDIENTGERLLQPKSYADLYSMEGGYVGRFKVKKRTLYPGTSIRVKIPFKEVEAGEYKAQVVADCKGDNLFGVVYNLTLK